MISITEPTTTEERAARVSTIIALQNVRVHHELSTDERLILRLSNDVDIWRATAQLFFHISRCAVCQGPHDGCDEGGELEGICINMGGDPWALVE